MTVRTFRNCSFSLPLRKLVVLLSIASVAAATTTRSNSVATGFLFQPPFKSTNAGKISLKKESSSHPSSRASEAVRRRLEPLSSILDDLKNNNNIQSSKEEEGSGGGANGSVDFTNFNPFSYTASSSSSRLEYTTRINLRKTRMQELTSTLLNSLGNAMETQQVLEDYRDFLLEPLEDSQAVLVCHVKRLLTTRSSSRSSNKKITVWERAFSNGLILSFGPSVEYRAVC
jgi:hypothetical protein